MLGQFSFQVSSVNRFIILNFILDQGEVEAETDSYPPSSRLR